MTVDLYAVLQLMCVENQPMVSNTDETEVRSLYTYIRDIQPPLQVGIIGLLLEEVTGIFKSLVFF